MPSFLDLPLELRHKIYGYKHVGPAGSKEIKITGSSQLVPLLINLSRVNKQVNCEVKLFERGQALIHATLVTAEVTEYNFACLRKFLTFVEKSQNRFSNLSDFVVPSPGRAAAREIMVNLTITEDCFKHCEPSAVATFFEWLSRKGVPDIDIRYRVVAAHEPTLREKRDTDRRARTAFTYPYTMNVADTPKQVRAVASAEDDWLRARDVLRTDPRSPPPATDTSRLRRSTRAPTRYES